MVSEDYRQVSFHVWERMAEGWDRERRWLWDVSHAVGEWMVDALAPQPGQTILELASGTGETGFAAAAALGDEGKLISTDFAPNMVKSARAESQRLRLRMVEHRELDAERMDLEDDSADGVLCRWGFMLMADPAAALRETRRVLRHGGRLALSVWAAPESNCRVESVLRAMNPLRARGWLASRRRRVGCSAESPRAPKPGRSSDAVRTAPASLSL